MKNLKILLFILLLLLAALVRCAEIHDAAGNGDMVKVMELLTAEPSLIDARDRMEKTPLHWAAQGGQLAVAKYLVALGANVNAANIQKETPLVYAAEGGHLKLAKMLVASGADLNVRTTLLAAPIHYAIWADKADMVKLLLKKGADYKWDRGTGFTLILHEAANQQSLENVELFIKKGLDVNAKNKVGATPLHFAAMHGTPEIVSLLIKKGADVNAVSQNDWWPLDLAVKRGQAEIVALLLNAGAQVNVKDKKSQRAPLHVAAAKGYGKICALLIDGGADVNAEGPEGRTPLYYAVRYQHQGVCSLLKEKGGVLAKKTAGKNWLDEPLTSGHAIVWYLGHSGWAVKTQKHLLIFDYSKNDTLPDEPGLANGSIDPEELREMAVTVFASHTHSDHYMPEIFSWRQTVPKIAYIMGFKPENADGYTILPNREKNESNGLEIIPIESNDSGQGYFVKVDGVTIFHPGDHANRQHDFSGPFKKEIDFLADQGLKADIAFAPVSGCGFGDMVAVKKGVYYTMDRLAVRAVFPMHAGGSESRYRDFAKEAEAAGYDVPICLPEFCGDHFIVTPASVSSAFDSEAPGRESEKKQCCR
jgi:ankyrin repeat protein